MSYATNLGAMQAFADGVSVTAHNVANVSTRDFQRWSHTFTSNAQGGVQNTVEAGDPLRVVSGTPNPSGDRVSLAGDDMLRASPGSNTVDIGRETTSLLTDQRAFEASAAVITTRAAMDETLLGAIIDQRA